MVDSSEDCVTVNWWAVPPSGVRGLSVSETRKEANCKGTTSQKLTYRPNLKVPSLITPNSDGFNDDFIIEDLEFYASHHLQIFDRWGKKVLDTSSYKQDWKGEHGLYFYTLSVENIDFKGWVSVMK